MEPAGLIPTPETIPAPWGLLEFLGVFTLIIHLLFINVVLGGSLISLFARLRQPDLALDESVPGALARKITTFLALAITFGVAPLLFVQVLYGHFFYTSSVLMAFYWIMVIPLLLVAYYGAYIHARKFDSARGLSLFFLALSSLILLVIALIYENNISMMAQPGKWPEYFSNRNGTILNLGDPVLWPRYLHFITASVAVGGLFSALIWSFRVRRGDENGGSHVKSGLKIFSVATMIQVVIGFWFLLALPKEIMMKFMGQNLLYTVMLALGIVLALAAIITSTLGRLPATLVFLVSTVAVMVILRTFLRTSFLEGYFKVESLELVPQYDVLFLFVAVFVIGLAVVGYMLKLAFNAAAGKEAA
jgi:hypothetical protein